jgi:transposase-like protein
MSQGTRYSDQFKQATVEQLLKSRRTQKEIAADRGIATKTARRWMREREKYGPRWIAKRRDQQKQLAAKNKEIAKLKHELALMNEMNRFFSRETR